MLQNVETSGIKRRDQMKLFGSGGIAKIWTMKRTAYKKEHPLFLVELYVVLQLREWLQVYQCRLS